MKIETSAAPDEAPIVTSFPACLNHCAFFAAARDWGIDYRTAINRVRSRIFRGEFRPAASGRRSSCRSLPDAQKNDPAFTVK